MNDNKTNPGSAVAALQREIKTRTEVVRAIADLEEQLDADRICGSWLSTENRLSAVIRRLGSGMWRTVVYDAASDTLTIGCYGRFVAEDTIAAPDDEAIPADEYPFNE